MRIVADVNALEISIRGLVWSLGTSPYSERAGCTQIDFSIL